MESKHFLELKEKVEWLCRVLVETKNESARLKRLLLAAEGKIKKLSTGNGSGLLDLTRQNDRLKNERKLIKAKIEKMAAKLKKFYEE